MSHSVESSKFLPRKRTFLTASTSTISHSGLAIATTIPGNPDPLPMSATSVRPALRMDPPDALAAAAAFGGGGVSGCAWRSASTAASSARESSTWRTMSCSSTSHEGKAAR